MTRLTREEVRREACAIMALAYRSKADFAHPSDGFCDMCPGSKIDGWNFKNEGVVLAYVEQAVRERLVRDGVTPEATPSEWLPSMREWRARLRTAESAKATEPVTITQPTKAERRKGYGL